MPVYTYECEHCGQRFDAKQSFTDVSLTVCPNCGGKIHRVIQPVGVVFKGSGFYITDSKAKQNLATPGTKKDDAKPADGGSNGAEAPAATADSGSKTASENGGASKTEAPAKPAAETTKSTSSESK